MKKKNNLENNPYEKVFDDACRRLKDQIDLDILDQLPNSSADDLIKVPFPYGGARAQSYDWN